MIESGINIKQLSPFGLAVVKGTDADIVKKLHDALKQAMEQDNYREALERYDMESYYMSTEEYGAFAKQMAEQESKILESIGFEKK